MPWLNGVKLSFVHLYSTTARKKPAASSSLRFNCSGASTFFHGPITLGADCNVPPVVSMISTPSAFRNHDNRRFHRAAFLFHRDD